MLRDRLNLIRRRVGKFFLPHTFIEVCRDLLKLYREIEEEQECGIKVVRLASDADVHNAFFRFR